jgi:hypothetical protein
LVGDKHCRAGPIWLDERPRRGDGRRPGQQRGVVDGDTRSTDGAEDCGLSR